jgi:hypothetical protein
MPASRRKPRLADKPTPAQIGEVTVSYKPVVTCSECSAPLVHEAVPDGPESASAVLTGHFNLKHPR